MKFYFLLLVWTFLSTALKGQDVNIDPEDLADDFTLFQEGEGSYEDQYENAVEVLSTRYDLNRVSREELQMPGVLADAQIESFMRYRAEQGPIMDIHELQAIPLFNPDMIARLLPFVEVSEPRQASRLRRVWSPGHSYFISRYERTLEPKKGFSSSPGAPAAYAGSPDKVTLRFRSTQPGDYSIGLAAEKDAGEPFSLRRGPQPRGFDFSSFHLQLQQKGKIRNIVVGDFQPQFGQGLLLGGAFSAGKGSENIAMTRRANIGFLPYAGVQESNFHRGMALTVDATPWLGVSAFYSNIRRDATAGEDSLTAGSLPASGLHRTEGELANRKRIREQRCALILHLKRTHVDGGVIIEGTAFSVPVIPTLRLYNRFDFNASQNVNGGVFINFRHENVSFFGEAAHTQGAGSGVVAGVLISAHPRLDFTMVCRHYQRDFHTFYANAFSENTRPKNERGLYWAWKYQWTRQFSASGYTDLFSFPWLAFRRYAPKPGYEWFLRATYSPARQRSLFLQYREEMKFRNLTDMSALYRVAEGLKRNITLHCDFGVRDRLRMGSRVQYNSYTTGGHTTRGWALLQDVSFRAGSFRLTARHALFDTEHFDSRVYLYERDVWLAYSFPAFSGVGVRNYVLVEYKVQKHITLWVRYARTRMLNVEEIGTGDETIEGNTRNDVKFQVRYRF